MSTAPSGTRIGTRSLIGVDVGGSGIKGAHVDLATGTATGRIRIETPQPSTPEAVAAVAATLVEQLADAGPIGCTLPAVVVGGTVRTAAHIDESWIGTHAAARAGSIPGGSTAPGALTAQMGVPPGPVTTFSAMTIG